jgi:hypothetical protein
MRYRKSLGASYQHAAPSRYQAWSAIVTEGIMAGNGTMKILSRKKLSKTIILAGDDSLVMAYREINGVVRTERMTTFAVISPPRSVRVNAALLVETVIDGAYAIGALLVEEPDSASVLKAEEVKKVSVAPMRPGVRHKQRPM